MSPVASYPGNVEELIRVAAEKKRGKICLVSLTKPASAILASFERCGLDPRRFLILDAVSRVVEAQVRGENVIQVSGPGAVTELGVRLGELLGSGSLDLMIIDSVSVLTIYLPELEVLKFVHALVSRLRSRRIGGIFIVPSEDRETQVVKNLCMFVDAVIDLSPAGRSARD
ncbi:MAG: hypothetical protein QW356_08920 [Candidatus Hadarchaeales archaeon]